MGKAGSKRSKVGGAQHAATGEKVAFYLRVSKNDDGTCGSVADQERECRTFCEAKGYSVVAVYSDDGISGKRLKRRAGLQRMLRDADNGHFKKVVVFSLDRAGRSAFALVEVARRLDDAGVKLDSVKEGPCDEVQLALRALFSTIFMKNHHDHLMKGMIGLAMKGHNLARPPAGLRIVAGKAGKVEPDPPYDQLPGLANELLLDRGLNGQQIATELTRLGWRMPSGAVITRLHVVGSKFAYGLLTNPKYVGEPDWNRKSRTDSETRGSTTLLKDPSEVVSGPWNVRLVSRDRFDAAQERLAELNTGAFSHPPGKRRLLSGLTYCEKCLESASAGQADDPSRGKMLIRAADTKGRSRLRCDANYLNAGCPNGRTLYVDEVESLVLDAVGTQLAEPKFVEKFIEAYNGARAPLIAAYDSEKREVGRERAEAEKVVQNIVRGVAKGLLSDDEAEAQLQEARRRLSQAVARQRLLEASPVALKVESANLARVAKAIEDLKRLPPKDLWAPENRDALELFRSLIDKVVVKFHPEGRGWALEIHGLIGSLVAPPNSPLALTLLSKGYKKTELKGTHTSQILTILDLKFVLKVNKGGCRLLNGPAY